MYLFVYDGLASCASEEAPATPCNQEKQLTALFLHEIFLLYADLEIKIEDRGRKKKRLCRTDFMKYSSASTIYFDVVRRVHLEHCNTQAGVPLAITLKEAISADLMFTRYQKFSNKNKT